MCFTALVTAMALCARSQYSLLSVSMRRVHVVLSTAGFKDGGKPCHVRHARHVKPPRGEEASRKDGSILFESLAFC